jgi:uncharacterized membrane protein (UPF0127 family)
LFVLASLPRSVGWAERFGRAGAVALLVALVLVIARPTGRAADADTLEIVSKTGVHVFAVELAVSDEQRTRGLMFRRALPEGQGMLFKFEPDQVIQMWMHNTYISLDMIFIRSDGRILRIAENTKPESDNIISSGAPARGVLEVIAGTARKLGIAPGDRVAHPWFGGR